MIKQMGSQENSSFSRAKCTKPVTVCYLANWFWVLAIACLLIAWYLPMKSALRHTLYPPVQAGNRTASAFVALAYEGISDAEDEVSTELFEKHLRALKANGYVPITLSDVRDLLIDGKPVPERAVLTTFDHSRKTSYFGVKSLIRKYGWNAVMFLWTAPIQNHDPAALLWPYVRSMLSTGRWEIGAQSCDGFRQLKNTQTVASHYLTTPVWLKDEDRFESIEEFSNRLRQDCESCLQSIKRETSQVPLAYAYPYGDFGQYQQRAAAIRKLTLANISRYFQLAFVSGNFGLNTRTTDPLRLNRLAVRSAWSGEELVAHLDKLWPQKRLKEEQNLTDRTGSWIIDEGRFASEEGMLVLSATEQTTGAKIWVAGSDLWQDSYAKVSVDLENGGQFGIYLRAVPDRERYIYFGLNSNGNVWLRQKEEWEDPFTLASSKLRMLNGKRHEIEMYVRGRMFYAFHNGVSVFDERIELHGEVKQGMMGLSVWYPEINVARAHLGPISVHPQKPMLASWQFPYEEIYVTKWLHENAYRLTEVSPPLKMTGKDADTDPADNLSIYQMLAKVYHLNLVPKLSLSSKADLRRWLPGPLAERAENLKCDGIFVQTAGLSDLELSEFIPWLRGIGEALNERGLKLFAEIPFLSEKPQSAQSLAAMIPNLNFISSPEGAVPIASAGVPLVTREEIPAPSSPQDRPYYYELVSLPEISFREQKELKIKKLRKEGDAAFSSGDPERALAAYRDWHELDPENSEPLMLMGDAYARAGANERAVDCYKQSLQLNPGQIRLAVRAAELLDTSGKMDESRNILNTYARLFPENTIVLLGQSAWLQRHHQKEQADVLIKKVLEQQPRNPDALIARLRLNPEAAPDRQNLQQLYELEADTDVYTQLADAFWRYGIISVPEAYAVIEKFRTALSESADEQIRRIFSKINPRLEPVSENLKQHDLSDNWWIVGGQIVARDNYTAICADNTHREVYLRLIGSDRYRNGVIEATINDCSGSFWLYARRTENAFVRLGINDNREIHLQVWKDGAIENSQREKLPDLAYPLSFKLIISGDGAMGFVNENPLALTPLPLALDYPLGSFGLAAYAPENGKAKVEIQQINAQVLPAHIAFIPNFTESSDTDAVIDAVRRVLPQISHLSPLWYEVNSNGTIEHHKSTDEDLVRLFSRYYSLRLWPCIRMHGSQPFDVSQIENLARENNLSGFIILTDRIPQEEWLSALDQALKFSSLAVVIIGLDAETHYLGSAADWFPENSISQTINSLLVERDAQGRYQLENRIPQRTSVITFASK